MLFDGLGFSVLAAMCELGTSARGRGFGRSCYNIRFQVLRFLTYTWVVVKIMVPFGVPQIIGAV